MSVIDICDRSGLNARQVRMASRGRFRLLFPQIGAGTDLIDILEKDKVITDEIWLYWAKKGPEKLMKSLALQLSRSLKVDESEICEVVWQNYEAVQHC